MTVSDLYEAKLEFLNTKQLDSSMLVAIEQFTDFLANKIYMRDNE